MIKRPIRMAVSPDGLCKRTGCEQTKARVGTGTPPVRSWLFHVRFRLPVCQKGNLWGLCGKNPDERREGSGGRSGRGSHWDVLATQGGAGGGTQGGSGNCTNGKEAVPAADGGTVCRRPGKWFRTVSEVLVLSVLRETFCWPLSLSPPIA